jgi:acetate---CoA ligase (ADP-forming)
MSTNDQVRGLTPSGTTNSAAVARLLKPRAVAIVGASDDPRSIGGNVLANLKRAGFAGELHLVSRTRAEIGGHPCVASIDELPEGLDAIVLNLPQEAVLEAVAACGRRRVNAAVVFASGFAEAGPEGRALQERLAALARESGVLVSGPNCLGIVNYVDGIPLTFGEYQPMPAAGAAAGVAVIAQSGAIANAIRDSLVASGLRVTLLASTGNEATLAAEDFLAPILEDEATGVVALFLEQVRRPRQLRRLAARARDLGKRLVLMQAGRTHAARGAAQSHTGAVAGDLAVARTVLSHDGVAVVDGLDALTDVALLLALRPVPPPGRTAVMTNSGAMRGLAFDFAQHAGLDLAEWSPATAASLRDLFPPFVAIDNPLDLGTAAFAKPELMRRAAQLLLDDPGVSSLILSLFPGRPPQQVEKAEQLLPVVHASRKPTAFVMLGDPLPLDAGFMGLARAEGAALFRSTERAVRAMAAVNAVASSLASPASVSGVSAGDSEPLDLRHLPAGPVAEHQAKALLAAAGVPVPPGGLARDLPAAEAIAARLGVPVALKAQAASLPHKSEAGGVILNVGAGAAVRDAWDRLHTNIRHARPGLALDGVLVEAMAPRPPGSVELIVGARRDPHWGAVLMLGLGGIWVETLEDVVLLPAGTGKGAIVAALGRLKGAALLRGARGSPPVDIAAIADIARTVGGLMQRSPDIAELEINPLLAYPAGQGPLALDALIVMGVARETE